MVLDTKTKKKIIEFVVKKPRTIDEISKFLQNNWRTADRYIAQISKEDGSISTRVFREGTRGALKIVYCSALTPIHTSRIQEALFEKIRLGKKKYDFNPLDIYQHLDQKKRSAIIEDLDGEKQTNQKLIQFLNKTDDQLLILSGNLSWINLHENKNAVFETFKKIVDRGVSVKILTRVDIASLNNIRKILRLSEQTGKQIGIRHCDHPLRGFIIDSKVARLKEVKNPEKYKKGELSKETTIYYDFLDSDWVEWLEKVFWNLYSSSIDADKRIKTLESISQIL
ncbi:hypothetical protein HOK51_04280 [Candidatus Woesearchaeota archaeon]|jgi:hypothetical protein|nr:hypothetical protein [Candidatus Woesearchaeota archaeon]MBT6519040.1 hypothetical protein [Candidatus Woesearchaeota archaeon]MBT7367476.1 hypothetical protein [Candidatus Woesearchaeota archaeon]